MKSLYIDIDGVILSKNKGQGPLGLSLKENACDFIIWATQNFNCFWLTGWSVNGDKTMIKQALLPFLPKEAKHIKYAIWKDLKTEGIDLTNDQWIWIDDQLLRNEQKILSEVNMIKNFILVDTNDKSVDSMVEKIKNG